MMLPAVARSPVDVDAATVGPSSGVWGDDTLLVFDAHGVVLNRAFPTFLRRHATARGDDPRRVWRRWRRDLRLDCWEGRLDTAEAWRRLFPGDDPDELDRGLASTYAPGPVFDQVTASGQRAWLLSNHRTEWLLPQLHRFGLQHRFERVLVSDDLGIAKPDGEVFRIVRRDAGGGRVVVFDDSSRNVAAARRVGLEAFQVADVGRHGREQREPAHEPRSPGRSR
jgi:HAD superfamily hydrolase (TIGR01509 family)